MPPTIQSLLSRAAQQPKILFLIDGAGALLSAFMLGVVLVRLEAWFGIPLNTLYLLAVLPVGFALFDGYSYWWAGRHTALHLRVIAGLNLGYCCLSLALGVVHIASLTWLAWAYIIGEVVIVAGLAVVELRITMNDEQ